MKIAIVGAGAAGLMCACMLSAKHVVTVFEKNCEAGRKLLMTGKGRCNITNLVDTRTFLESVLKNSKFLTGCLYEFAPKDTIDFLTKLGITTHKEDNNRIFPTNKGGANFVRQAMENFAKQQGVEFVFNTSVTKILKTEHGFKINANDNSYLYDLVIVATGGVSFPITGSTGDGYIFAKKFGHTIISPRPSLCGLKLSKPASQQGMSVFCGVEILNNKTEVCTKKSIGNMLFTKSGVSGPVIFEIVSKFKENIIKEHWLQIDFMPKYSISEGEVELLFKLSSNPKKQLFSIVRGYMPVSVADWFFKTSNLDATKLCGQITKEDRTKLLSSIRKMRVLIKDFEDIDIATVTRGGINVSEINSKTMESKIIKGLYFIGEILNVDALSGGFNLQIAFSTAASCAKAINLI